MNDLNASLGQTKESIAETQKRIDALEQLSRTTPARLATQERRADDGLVLQQLETTLLNLQLKHSDMISKYQADYRPVQELEREIAETRAAIGAEKPLSDNTTDQNPTVCMDKSELAKGHADLKGYQAKATETETIIGQTQVNVRRLDEDSVDQQNSVRSAKAAEENYLLYLHKREEARITDALDQSHILNVAVAEQPTVPVFPTQSRLMFGLFGMVLAVAASAGTIFTLESLDSTFRTPAQVQTLLSIPVLATFPDQNSSANLLQDRNDS